MNFTDKLTENKKTNHLNYGWLAIYHHRMDMMAGIGRVTPKVEALLRLYEDARIKQEILLKYVHLARVATQLMVSDIDNDDIEVQRARLVEALQLKDLAMELLNA